MDFGKSLVKEENVITESGIRLLPVPPEDVAREEREKSLVNRMLIQSANNAAMDLFCSTGSKLFSTFRTKKRKQQDNDNEQQQQSKEEEDEGTGEAAQLANCRLYHSLLLPPTPTITPSSLVVIFESFDSLNFVYATPRAIFNNRNGHFHHDDFIGKPYGSKVRSRNNRGLGFVYLLKPTPELWARSLTHRTQIVHELDASMVVFQLGLKPNMVVCESGTGSGAMSHAVLRAVAPYGKLHTYEFNRMRVQAARKDFRSNGLSHLVQVHWRDVCGTPLPNPSQTQQQQDEQDERMGSGGFDIGPSAAHAIFLDLPEPWLAIPHAAYTLHPNAIIASYSPCVEQSQRTVQKMTECGFHSIRTLEVRLREHYVDELSLDTVPTDKLPREPNVNPFVPGVSPIQEPKSKQKDKTSVGGNGNGDEDGGKDGGMESSSSPSTNLTTEPADKAVSKKRKLLCARPFASIRGHTAFLTFATNGNKPLSTSTDAGQSTDNTKGSKEEGRLQ